LTGEQVADTVDGQKADALGSGLKATSTLRLIDNHSPAKPTAPPTRTLKQLLSQVDVQVLDHVIVGSGEAISFAEESLI
jgi:hypothetical protein